MSVRCFEILTEREFRRDRSSQGNRIPSGRQLPRTPPMTDVKKHLDFSHVAYQEPRRLTGASGRASGDQDQNRTFASSTPPTKRNAAEPDQPNSMLKGMKGYQLTAGDLEFIKRLQEEKLIKKYLGDLEDVQRLLKKETMALEMEHASWKKAQVELSKFPSCEKLTEWATVVLQVAAPSTDLTDLDAKSLLAMVTPENVRTAIDEKKLQLTRLENMVAEKRKKEAEMRGRREKQIANEQLKIQGLMSQLSDLTSELSQQEDIYKTLQMQVKKREESGVVAGKEDASEEEQAKGQVQRGQKDKKKGGKSAEKVQDAPKQNKVTSTRSKCTDSQNVGEDGRSVGASEKLTTTETKPKSKAKVRTTKSVKASRGSQKKVEDQESSSRDSRAVRGGRKPPGITQTAASQPKDQRKAKSRGAPSTPHQAAPALGRGKVAAAAAEETQGTGLRRSRRIASRR